MAAAEEEVDTRSDELYIAPDDDDMPLHIGTSSPPSRLALSPPKPKRASYFFGSTAPKRKRFPTLEDDPEDSSSDFKFESEAEESDGGWNISGGGDGLIAAKQRHERKRKAAKPIPRPPAAKKPKTLAEEIDDLAAGPAPQAGVVKDAPPAYIPGDLNGGEIPAPPDIYDWTELNEAEEEENPISKDWCAMCKVTQRELDVDESNIYYKDMIEYAHKNWILVSAGEMGTELQRKYNDTVRFYIEPEEMQLPCRKETFWLHFVEHRSDPLIDALIQAKIVQDMIATMGKEQLFVIDPLTRRKKVTNNHKTSGMFFKLCAQKEKLTKLIASLQKGNGVL